MKVYIYDENTKEYLFEDDLPENPLEKGKYIYPLNSTVIEPPECGEGQVPCFVDNTEWVIFVDHRNKPQVNLETLEFTTVDYIGDAQEGFQFVSDEIYEDYQTDHEKYKVIDGVFTDISDTEEYQEILRRREAERIAQLSLTKREVFLALYADKGITPEQIRAELTDVAALIEFDFAERYFRGNTLIDLLGQKLGYTKQQLDTLFETGSF